MHTYTLIHTHTHTPQLVLGAGEGATIREVVKHENIETCWWSDIDPDLVDLCEEHLCYVRVCVWW